MESSIGNKRIDLKQALDQEAYRFDFDQAMHLLELVYFKDHDKHKDFDLCKHFDFDPVQIKGHISMAPQASPLWKCDVMGQKKTLWINFLNLAGANGPLPIPYTEILLDRLREKDHSFVDFLDIFQHRLARLWYHFQKTIHPSLMNRPASNTLFGTVLTRLVGVSNEMPENLKSYVGFLQLFSQNELSIHQIERLLVYYFNLHITIKSFIGSFIEIKENDRTKIGLKNSSWNKLGQQTYLGHKIWDVCGKVVIIISNLSYETYLDFCPNQTEDSSHYQMFKVLCRSFFKYGRKIFIQLNLHPKEIPYLILKKHTAYPLVLGFNTWLKSRPQSKIDYKIMKIAG